MWQSSHALAAKGMWTLALKSFGSVDACGSWQLVQFITEGSMFRCAAPKFARPVAWHSPHKGWTGCFISESLLDVCGT